MSITLLLSVAMLTSFGAAEAQTDCIDLSQAWRFQPDPGNTGLEKGWQAPLFDDSGWPLLEAGKRWEDQGYPDVDGYAWYRRHVAVPEAWKGRPVWLIFGGVNDACVVFCNGERINAYGDDHEVSVNSIPLIAQVGSRLRFGEDNVLTVQVLDWGGSGGLWRLPCALTADPEQLPLDEFVSCHADVAANELVISTDLSCLGRDSLASVVHVRVFAHGAESPMAERRIPVPAGETGVSTEIRAEGALEGAAFEVHVSALDAAGEILESVTGRRRFAWPAQPSWTGDYASLKVRNNFVTELLAAGSDGPADAVHSFLNPRDGWVFFSSSAEAAGPRVFVDGDLKPLAWRSNPDTDALEAMRRLTEGKHRLTLVSEAACAVEVRTVPEMAFCYYPSTRHIQAYPEYDWNYVSRYVLPHVNTIISRGDIPEEDFAEWLAEGRQWIGNASLPGLGSKEAPLARDVYTTWAQNRGARAPGFSGIMVDEFLWSGAGHYRAWGDAVSRLHHTPAFEGRTFYAWCTEIHGQKPSRAFSQRLMGLGHRFAWEVYLREQATEKEARRYLLQQLQGGLSRWRKALPGIEDHMIVCLGYLSAPPETLNLDPAVDYHVFLDMQFHLMATSPAFWRLYGVMEYMAAYADEESLRFAHKLFRHYCIEGRRDRYTQDPYALAHIVNPDFARGLEGWRVEPAKEGSVRTGEMEGFGWLQGRYPRTDMGDRFCVMECANAGSNRVAQTVQGLEAGRVYSVKCISANLDRLGEKHETPLDITVEGAEELGEFRFKFPYPSCYSHEVGAYTREHPAYFNFHRLVFKAKGATAELVISDPGGEEGQEAAFNFIEVQPFHAP